MHFLHLQMEIMHLAMHFGSLQGDLGTLELPGGVLRGPNDMGDLLIENPVEYGDSSSTNWTC